MARSEQRNEIGERMREAAIKIAADKIARAKAYAQQTADMQILMLFGRDEG